MPCLKRRVFAPEDVISTYKSYCKNQELYMTKISKANDNVMTKDIIKSMLFEKFGRSIDRAKLDLKMKMKNPEIHQEGDDSEKMKTLVNKWWGSGSIIGRILKFVYESEVGVNETELKEFIEEAGSENVCELYNELVRVKRGHSSVFRRSTNQITSLREDAKKYIRSL